MSNRKFQHYRPSFLKIATEGAYGPRSEDRLTQIIVAAFMHSMTFQKIFLKFIGIPFFRGNLHIQTRIFTEDNKKPDIVVFRNQKAIGVIECKTQSKLRMNQLNDYHQICTNRTILTEFHEAKELVPKGWKRKNWGEFLALLEKTKIQKGVESWIIKQTIEYFRERGIKTMSTLNIRDLRSIYSFLWEIRYEKKPEIQASNAINRLAALDYILVEAFEILCHDIDNKKYFGKRPRPSTKIEWRDWKDSEGMKDFGLGLMSIPIIRKTSIRHISVELSVRKTGSPQLHFKTWRKAKKADLVKAPFIQLDSHPISVGRELSPRGLALQLKSILMKYK